MDERILIRSEQRRREILPWFRVKVNEPRRTDRIVFTVTDLRKTVFRSVPLVCVMSDDSLWRAYVLVFARTNVQNQKQLETMIRAFHDNRRPSEGHTIAFTRHLG